MLRFQSHQFSHSFNHSFIHSFIHSYLSVKELSYKTHRKQSPFMEPYVEGRLKYNGVQPSSPRESFMTLLLIPQCHAAFNTIPSILAWVGQSPFSQCVL